MAMKLSSQEIASLRLILKKIAFLEHLKLNEVDELISALDKRPFHVGEVIIKQGTPGETFFILASGKVGVYKERFLSSKKIADLGSETFFGEMALLDNSARHATVVGEADGEVWFLPRETFKKVLLNNPAIGASIRQTAAYREAQNLALDMKKK